MPQSNQPMRKVVGISSIKWLAYSPTQYYYPYQVQERNGQYKQRHQNGPMPGAFGGVKVRQDRQYCQQVAYEMASRVTKESPGMGEIVRQKAEQGSHPYKCDCCDQVLPRGR